jgi:hypothetical protein
MRCRAKKRVRKARGAADIANIGKPSNAADVVALADWNASFE